MTTRCPSPEELSRALGHGATRHLVEHLVSCDSCSDEWDAARRLRALAQALPVAAPRGARVAELRARVVSRGMATRRTARSRPGLAAALAFAAAVALAAGARRLATRPSPEPTSARYHGVITAAPGARYHRMSAAPDEVVLLESGMVHVEVSPLGGGERFRVKAADREVEVRGTAFDVAVVAGHMSAVTVEHGRVEVRDGSTVAAVLGAGDAWHAAPSSATAAETSRGAAPASSTTAAEAFSGAAPASSVTAAETSRGAAPASSGAAPSPHRAAVAPRAAHRERLAPRAVASAETASALPSAPVSPERSSSPEGVASPMAAQLVPASNPARIAPPPGSSPAMPKATPEGATAPSREPPDRDEERRDRREERRERYDQRRMR